jgi:hypothetical protein
MIALGIPLSEISRVMDYFGFIANFYVYFFICILQYQIIALLTWKLGRKKEIFRNDGRRIADPEK